MCAFVVSKAHTDALVNAAAQLGVISTADQARAFGRAIWSENVRSVNYRYDVPDNVKATLLKTPGGYRPEATESQFHPLAVLKVLTCYEYQACERPDWEKSDAYTWCQRLRAAAEARLPPDYTRMVRSNFGRQVKAYTLTQVYKDMPWAIESLSDMPLGDQPGRSPQ